MSDPQKVVQMSAEELEEAVQRGVTRALIQLGLDTSEPIDMQRDMQFLRDLRRSTESVKGKALVTVVGILIAGGMAALWLGFKHMLHAPN